MKFEFPATRLNKVGNSSSRWSDQIWSSSIAVIKFWSILKKFSSSSKVFWGPLTNDCYEMEKKNRLAAINARASLHSSAIRVGIKWPQNWTFERSCPDELVGTKYNSTKKRIVEEEEAHVACNHFGLNHLLNVGK